MNCEISVKSVALLNLVARTHALVHIEINFLSSSFDRPTIEESFNKMGPKGTQGKRKQQVRKSDRGSVKRSHFRCELLKACR